MVSKSRGLITGVTSNLLFTWPPALRLADFMCVVPRMEPLFSLTPCCALCLFSERSQPSWSQWFTLHACLYSPILVYFLPKVNADYQVNLVDSVQVFYIFTGFFYLFTVVLSLAEKRILKFLFIIMDLSFSFCFCCFCFMYTETRFLDAYTFGIVMYCWWTDIFNVMKSTSLALIIFLALKSLFDVNTAILLVSVSLVCPFPSL